MSLAPAENIGGGEFLDLKTMIAASGRPILAVARIVEYAPHGVPAQGTGWTGTNYPVKADVLICSGPGTGEAHLGEVFITGAITKTLRGVPNPKDGTPLSPPKYPVGHELGVKFEIKNPGAANAFVVANAPSPEEFAAISQVHAGGQGWANAQVSAAPAAPAVPGLPPGVTPEMLAAFAAQQAQQAQTAPVPATVGGAQTDPPW